MSTISKEVEENTDATISCIVSGITKKLDSVSWTKGGTDVTTLSEDNSYVVSAGTYGSNSQTTTLTVKAAANTADSTYTCVITSNEWVETDKETVATLNVFGECHPITPNVQAHQPLCFVQLHHLLRYQFDPIQTFSCYI